MKIKQATQSIQDALKELTDIKYALDVAAIVAITDHQGRIIYANDTFCTISKYPLNELIGQNHRILNSGTHSKEFFRQMWRTIASGNVWQGEICNRNKQGGLYWVDTTIVPFLNEKGKPYQYVSIRYEITARKLMEAEIKSLPRRIMQAQEEESNRIAREIHDDLGQSLATLKMFLQRALAKINSTEGLTKNEQARVCAYMDETIAKSRQLSNRLRPSTLDVIGLTSSIKLLIGDLNKAHRNIIQARVPHLDDLIFHAPAIHLLRIIQEALNNAIKHAKAKSIKVAVSLKKDRLVVTIFDDGLGFKQPVLSSGLGLLIMRERAEALQGSLIVKTQIKQGTTITIDVPVKTEIV